VLWLVGGTVELRADEPGADMLGIDDELKMGGEMMELLSRMAFMYHA
jgi:hypothetical protein